MAYATVPFFTFLFPYRIDSENTKLIFLFRSYSNENNNFLSTYSA